MKKRYSPCGSYAGGIPGLFQVSKNTYVYLGFTIRKASRNHLNGRDSYLIYKWDDEYKVDNYYGRDFDLAEIIRTIKNLKEGRGYQN